MKVHKYEKWFFDDWEYSEKRLYIPNYGVIEYFDNKVSFFSDKTEDINYAEKIIARNLPDEYKGLVEIPNDEVLQLVEVGKKLNIIEKEFKEIGKKLFDKIKDP